jgi:hypothetical protein
VEENDTRRRGVWWSLRPERSKRWRNPAMHPWCTGRSSSASITSSTTISIDSSIRFVLLLVALAGCSRLFKGARVSVVHVWASGRGTPSAFTAKPGVRAGRNGVFACN